MAIPPPQCGAAAVHLLHDLNFCRPDDVRFPRTPVFMKMEDFQPQARFSLFPESKPAQL